MRSADRTVTVNTHQSNPHMVQLSKHKMKPLLQADNP